MNQDWPQSKLYLYGQLAFLPADLDHKALRKEKLRHYLPPESADEPEAALRDYEQKGYFQVGLMSNAGEPIRYMLSDINSTMFRDELVAYLEVAKLKLPAATRELLWDAAAKQHRQHGYSPTVNWRDIYGDSTRYDYTPPFWELIFLAVADGSVRLSHIDYEKTVPYLVSGNSVIDMPKAMLRFYERPYAQFEIIDKVLRQRIAKPSSSANYTATLRLDGKKLWLHIGKKRYLIRRYQGRKSNSFRAISELYNRQTALTKSDLNLKPNSKTELKDLPNNMGFKGVMRELFIELADDKKLHRPTVLLRKTVAMDDEQYERLLQYVKTIPMDSE